MPEKKIPVAKTKLPEKRVTEKVKLPEGHALIETYRKKLLVNYMAGVKFPAPFGYTYWEELTCVGYHPLMSQLEAVVSIKQSSGYGSGLCGSGGTEYVRFFVDWGDGAGFQHLGLTSFKVFDISDAPAGPQHPLQHMVYLPLDPTGHTEPCDTAVLPKVRAVLSYSVPPSMDPDDMPYYGNRLDVIIQIKPRLWMIKDLFDRFKKYKITIDKLPPVILKHFELEYEIPKPHPGPVPLSDLAAAYKKAAVPVHRYGYPAMQTMSMNAGEAQKVVLAQTDFSFLKEYGILKLADALGATNADISYEELTCVGLNSATDILGGVIQIKRPYGYSGALCQPGSMEYVAFWADWNNDGVFDEYLGTAQVEVHDLTDLPADGLAYSVMLPCNFSAHLKTCDQPVVVRVRGVLSWASAPSTTDPNALPVWGNMLDVVVQLRPVKVPPSAGLMALLYDVGNVALDDIDAASHLAYPAPIPLTGSQCGSALYDRPFAGTISIHGRIYNTGAPESVFYRVEYSPHLVNAWLPAFHDATVTLAHPYLYDPLYPHEHQYHYDPDGWLPYEEDPTATPPILEQNAYLGTWDASGLNGVYDVRLVYCQGDPDAPGAIWHYTPTVTIKIDNSYWTVNPGFAGGPAAALDKSYDMDIIIVGGDCKTYIKKEVITGKLHVAKSSFWYWRLDLQPSSHIHGTAAVPHYRSYISLTDTGDDELTWTLDTSKLDPCGYTLTLFAYDRAIVNSNGAVVHWNYKAVGFSVT